MKETPFSVADEGSPWIPHNRTRGDSQFNSRKIKEVGHVDPLCGRLRPGSLRFAEEADRSLDDAELEDANPTEEAEAEMEESREPWMCESKSFS